MAGERLAARIGGLFLREVVMRLGAVAELVKAMRTRSRIASFQRRITIVRRFPATPTERARPRVLAVVTHVADPTRADDTGAERLERTLDGLLESLGHTRIELVLNTLPKRHLAARLPDHLRDRLQVRERDGVEPMYAGFEAQREFVERVGEFDWFLYLEDDLVLQDALVLDKLAFFNEGAPPGSVLLPHRYELWQGRKTYVDLVSKATPEWIWNRLTTIDIAGWRFAEFENPHSGCYFLSRAQLDRWLATGRRWYGQTSYYGPRESAATGCLAEAFRLYKPHPDNLEYLQIRHWDTKYSRFYGEIHGAAASLPR